MRARGWRLAALGVSSVALMSAGCSLLAGRPAGPTTAAATGPSTQPTTRASGWKGGYEPAKALLPLESIPPVAEMPSPQEQPDRAIPPQAIKHYLAARDLFHQWMNAECIAAL